MQSARFVQVRGASPRHFAAITVALALALWGCATQAKFLFGGDSRELRARPPGAPPSSPAHARVLVVALDGVDRALLYEMLRAGELPAFARLLGGQRGRAFPSAYFSDRLVSTLPSSTIAAWVTAFTGVGPAQHGVTGNGFFVREERSFKAPAPASFADDAAVLSNYTEHYLDRMALAPSVYERMRASDPDVLAWVAMQHFHRGADRLLLTKPTPLARSAACLGKRPSRRCSRAARSPIGPSNQRE
ncbi:MAG: alkaline phosphatase family protein [Polyangiaceae bacterium]